MQRLLLCLSCATVVMLACSAEQAAPEVLRPVRIIDVSLHHLRGKNYYSGDIQARYHSKLSFRSNGKIIQRLVEVGDQVKAGQILFRLDPQDAILTRQSSEQQWLAAKSDYLQAALANKRAQELLAKQFISQAEADQKQLLVDAALAKLNAAEAQYSLAKHQVDYTVLRASHRGIVTAIYYDSGQVIASGQIVIDIARDGERDVVISVAESQMETLNTDTLFDIRLWAKPDKRYQGKLRELAPNADPLTRTYTAKISLNHADEDILLGMTAQVSWRDDDSAKDRYLLPLSAIYAKNGQSFVWRFDPQSATVQQQPVTIAGTAEEQVIISQGVRVGDKIVTAGVHLLSPGQKVRILNEAATPPAKAE